VCTRSTIRTATRTTPGPIANDVLTPEQVQARYSKSKIGHSYSVWIPWDQVGGVQKEIALIVRFEPKDGAAVVGEQAPLLLPGHPARAAGAAGGAEDRHPVCPEAPGYHRTGQMSDRQMPDRQECLSSGWQQRSLGPGMGGVQPISYEAAVPPGNPPNQDDDGRLRRMTTTTIAISRRHGARQTLPAGPATAPMGIGSRRPLGGRIRRS